MINRVRPGVLAFALMLGAPSVACASEPTPKPDQLDFLIGDWLLFDDAGQQVGHSEVVELVPGSLLFEERTIANRDAQPLWFEHSEAHDGWTQGFVGPLGMTRDFVPVAGTDDLPVVMGADITLRDGRDVRFQMTLTPVSDTENHRVLEMTADEGETWSTVFSYHYRRSASQ